jgi:hypothetical protein
MTLTWAWRLPTNDKVASMRATALSWEGKTRPFTRSCVAPRKLIIYVGANSDFSQLMRNPSDETVRTTNAIIFFRFSRLRP